MSHHLASLRLRSVGERSARFTDLTLNTTRPYDGIPTPADSVFWLRNGGGKSSLLSLFYALLLPRATDFMGKTVKRSLTDYIDTGDTSHTVAVWHPTSGPTNLMGEPDQVLVTGAVYEWADLRRPTDADKARDRLHADFYTFYAVPGVLDPTMLPVEDGNGLPLRRTQFLAALRQLAEQQPNAIDLVITDKQHVWQSELVNRGLDPEVFRTQKEMNHVEGGVEDLFRFATPRAFIDFLLDLTVAPDEASSVAERLSDIANVLATKPNLLAERDFCLEAVTGLDRVHAAHQDVLLAVDDTAAATKEAADLSAVFAATVTAGQAAVDQIVTEREPLQRAVSSLNTDAAVANDLAFLYRVRAAEIRVEDAEATHATAQAGVLTAQHANAAWAATEPLAEQNELTAALLRTRQEMAVEREQTQPLIDDHDEHAARLRLRLHTLAGQYDATARDETAAARTLAATAQAEHSEATAQSAKAREADRQAASVTTLLDTLSGDITAAVSQGLLPNADTDPSEHAATVSGHRDERARALHAVQDRRAARPEQRAALGSTLAEQSSQRTSIEAEQSAARAEVDTLSERVTALVNNGRVRALVEADADAPVDLWAEADTLTRRLTDEVREADEDLVRQEAGRLDDRRLLDGQARNGLIPTSLDAEKVERALLADGIDATPGWSYLRAHWPTDRLAVALTDPDVARLGCGIVVPTDRAEAARDALRHLDVTTVALVAVYTATDAERLVTGSSADQAAWIGLHEGLLHEEAAARAAERVSVSQNEYQTRRQAVVSQRDSDRALLHTLHVLLDEVPAARLDALTRRIESLEQALTEADDALEATRSALRQLDADEAADRSEEHRLSNEVQAFDRTLTRLADLAARTGQASGWRTSRDEAERTAETARAAAALAAEASRVTGEQAVERRAAAKAASQQAESARATRSQVRFLGQDPGQVEDDPDVTLDALIARRNAASRAHEVQVSHSVLEERHRSDSERLGKVEAALARVPSDVLATAQGLLHSPEGQADDTRAVARDAAQRALSDAQTGVGRAEEAVATATRTVREIRARRTDQPTRRMAEQPATADEADVLAATQERASQQIRENLNATEEHLRRLATQQQTVEARIKDFTLLRDDLPESAGDAAQPYPGDDAEAREERRRVMQSLDQAKARHNEAQSRLTQTVADLRSKAALYAAVTTTAKDRLLHDPQEVIADKAHDTARLLTVRAAQIDGLLGGIERDQAVIATSLAHLVKTTLDTLRKAERYSMLPKTIGAWAGKPMLTIRFDAPTTDNDLLAYVNRVIERRIDEGVKAEGLPLLKDAVHEAVGPAGFKVKVLKPTEDVATNREDITRLGKWSGGEKLTVCVALYCTIAALRAANTGRRDRSGGVLLLDNPIGRASHGSLVMLQRNVAAAHGVQLIYTTGVKDPDAVSRFPNVVRLDNRAGRTRNRRYIVENPEDTATDDQPHQVIGVRIAHHDTHNEPAGDDGP